MSTYAIAAMRGLLKDNSYPGRGIVLGQTPDATRAVAAYFIMGRSENSRNRVFVEQGEEVVIHPFDASKVADPSLIIYSPIRSYRNHLIVTNGDQTDTVYDHLAAGKSFEAALETRCFEPDAPNFTPRISGLLTFEGGSFRYCMSILKSGDAKGSACNRFTYAYRPLPGLGHFLHTYRYDGNPIPTFEGEPKRVMISDDLDEFSSELWESLNEQNRISLYVRYIDAATGNHESRLINKNK